jgi:tRNA 2-thiouridine synthesizing protein A
MVLRRAERKIRAEVPVMTIAMPATGAAPSRRPPVADHEIDARGRFSPGPLLELVRTVHQVPRGQAVALLSDDPATLREVEAWLAREHHAFLGSFPESGATRVLVRRTH